MQAPEIYNSEKKKRSDLLTVMCLFSFIGGGLSAFSNTIIYLSYDEIGQMMPEIERILKEMDFEGNEFNQMLSGGKQYFLAGGVLNMISLAGVLRMWRLKKIGFHLYVAAQIFLFILPMVSYENLPFNFIGLMLTAAFIFAYTTQLKDMS